MTKKYRLKKDLPDVKAGAFVIRNDGGTMFYIPHDRFSIYRFSEEQMLSQPDWFEEVEPEPERIEIIKVDYLYELGLGKSHIDIKFNKEVPKGQFPAIKEAIEKAVNPETDLQKEKDAIQLGELKPKTLPPLFVTEDNVPVYLNQRVWWVRGSDFEVNFHDFYEEEDWFPDKFKYFSTKQAADEYVLMNKPTLSVSDILNSWYSEEERKNMSLAHSYDFHKEDVGRRDPLFVRLKELAKSKQQNH